MMLRDRSRFNNHFRCFNGSLHKPDAAGGHGAVDGSWLIADASYVTAAAEWTRSWDFAGSDTYWLRSGVCGQIDRDCAPVPLVLAAPGTMHVVDHGDQRDEVHREDSRVGETIAELASGLVGSGVGLAIAGPTGALAGAALTPLARVSLADLLARIGARREERVEFVIKAAAKQADLSPRELMQRMESDPDRAALLVRALQAAQDKAAIKHLVALALSLARPSTNGDSQLPIETALVRAIAACDPVHIRLLGAFEMTANDLGLGDGSVEFDRRLERLNSRQLEMAGENLALGDARDYLTATLEMLGLIRTVDVSRTARYGQSLVGWSITQFGGVLLARLRTASELLVPER